MKYIEKPNLPQGRVGLVAISSHARETIVKLENLGIKTIEIAPDLRLPMPINTHADIQMLHSGNDLLFVQDEHLCVGESDKNFNCRIISESPGDKYPDDVRLNCAVIGNKVICNSKTISKEVFEYFERNSYTIINVNQGYSKCSVCIVDENSIIIDDKSIFTAAQNFFNDVLLVSKGSVQLNGYNYGFIGGCCGKTDKYKLAFNGTLESHTDYKLIVDFLNKHNIECIELNSGPLTDIGGILPLMEL